MKWILYFHPESDCLFWSKGDMYEHCTEIGESDTRTKDDARKLYGDFLLKSGIMINEHLFNMVYHRE